jgi:hypothetical protein
MEACMAGWQDWVQWRISAGNSIQVGDVTVTPLAQALVVRPPWQAGSDRRGGAFIWNRPVAVLVERAGQSERLPIVDITRIVVWSLMAGVLLVGAGLAASRRNKERR